MTTRFKPYPSYKDSGVEWLGRIPTHWQQKRIRHVFRCVNGSTPKSGESDYWDGEIPWVTPDDLGQLETCTISATGRKITKQGYESCGTMLSPKGSLVLSTRAPIGHLAIATMDFCTNQGCRSLVFRNADENRYFYYLLLCGREELQSWGQGSTFQELATEKLKAVILPSPPYAEQQTIASFLDRETGKIDALVKKKERLIELLQEKRTALISHAVTQGLNPNARKKDSGIPWLGHIPKHWEVKRLKFIAEVRSGAAKGRDFGERDTMEVPYLRVANVQDGYLDLFDVATIVIAKTELKRFSLRKGDVLMNEGGDYDKLGRGSVWQGQVAPCVHQNHVFAVRPRQVQDADWINTITLTSYAKFYFMLRSKQSTNLASISGTNIQELPMVMPPMSERQTILRFLDRETAKLDALITKVRTAIKRLQEYRTALISAAVTGQIDVRSHSNTNILTP